MKLNKIFIGGLAMLALTSCSDFLEVDPATDTANTEFVFNSESEIETALNGVYAQLLSNNTFGRRLYYDFLLNSDVDFATNSNENNSGTNPRRFDNRTDNGAINTLWNNLYTGVETANEFIYNLQKSAIYTEGTENVAIEGEGGSIESVEEPAVTALTQMMGEAKFIRAMFYHELLSYFGDIPFTLESTYQTDNLLPPVTPRQKVSDELIADLRHAAEYMRSDAQLSDAPERIGKEAAYAMIARLALQAGGYSLNHPEGDDKSYSMTRPSNYRDYYEIAREYSKKVIDSETHQLRKSFRQVFVDECNFIAEPGDDPIFEIPFAKESTSGWGYYQGPRSQVESTGERYSNANWGATGGNVGVSALYRYSFDERDLRRDYIIGFIQWSTLGVPSTNISYTNYNNKWSKLWNTTGFEFTSTDQTGINYAYIRYADVLLMFAEAENEVNGPTEDAKEALKTVRRRAFAQNLHATKVDTYVNQAAGNGKEAFLKAVLDERKWEFAGENMRWKDLVRNKQYAERLFYTFLTYVSIAQDQGGNADYMDMVEEYEDIPYSQLHTSEVYWCYIRNDQDPNFPNNSLYKAFFINPYGSHSKYGRTKPGVQPNTFFQSGDYEELEGLVAIAPNQIVSSASSTLQWETAGTSWWDENQGMPNTNVLFSLSGYIYLDRNGNYYVVDNGVVRTLSINASNAEATVNGLPAVSYLLPYPEEAISRSNGVYKNYYGY